MNKCRGKLRWDYGINSVRFFREKFHFLIPLFLYASILKQLAYKHTAFSNGMNRSHLRGSPILPVSSNSVNTKIGRRCVTLAAFIMLMTIFHILSYPRWITRQWHDSSRQWHIKTVLES